MRDVLVVGSGPGGLAVALGAARAGMNVAVFERRSGAIDKACGEGLMPAAVRALAALGVEPEGFPIRGIRYIDGKHAVAADFRSGPGRGVRRTVLHAALRAAVDAAGIEVHERAISGVVQEPDHVEAGGLRARYLVAADGLHSPIRRALGLSLRSERSRNRWGQRRHYRVESVSDFVEVHWAERSEAYVTPVAADTIGVAILSGVRESYDEQLALFPALADVLRSACPLSPVLGAGPLLQRTRSRVVGRVLLVGDAAGYVDALTGEGIAIALTTAAELVACIAADRPLSYERAWQRASRRSRALTSGLLWTRQHPPLNRCIVPLAARVPGLFEASVNQLAG